VHGPSDFHGFASCLPTLAADRTSTSPSAEGVHPKRPQTKTATKRPQSERYQNHIDLANEKSFGHQIFIITDEI